MKALKCDRCGTYYEEVGFKDEKLGTFWDITVNHTLKNRQAQHSGVDLCPRCKESFLNWMRMTKEFYYDHA